jgi:hypothetical protein
MVGLVGTRSERFRKVALSPDDVARLSVLQARHSFDGDGRLLRLGLQAYSLGIAYEFDPYFGLSISRVDPLPHPASRAKGRDWPRSFGESARRNCQMLWIGRVS